MPALTAEAITEIIHHHFEQARSGGIQCDLAEDNRIRLRLPFHELHLRPGGTIAGPTLMMLADTAMLMLTLAMYGGEHIGVTSSLNIHFLRRPKPADITAEAVLLNRGKRTAVGEVRLYTDGEPDPVAHATVAYVLPRT